MSDSFVNEINKMNKNNSYKQNLEDEEIDLYLLFIKLWTKKWHFISIVAFFIVISIYYSFSIPPTYRATSYILPPRESEVQSLYVENTSAIDDYNKNSETKKNLEIFKEFLNNLLYRQNQSKFIKENNLTELFSKNPDDNLNQTEMLEIFSTMIKVSSYEEFGKKGESIGVSVEFNDPDISAKLVNDYIIFVEKELITKKLENLRELITSEILRIEYMIKSKRKLAKQRRQDQIIRFEEAKIIAESLGFDRRIDATNIIQNTNQNMDITSVTTPLYYIGTKALSAEIDLLKNRDTDDPFILGLRDLQEKHDLLLQYMNVDKNSLRSVLIDQKAYSPKNRISPNRTLITSIGTIGGFFFAIIIILSISFFQNQKKNHFEKK